MVTAANYPVALVSNGQNTRATTPAPFDLAEPAFIIYEERRLIHFRLASTMDRYDYNGYEDESDFDDPEQSDDESEDELDEIPASEHPTGEQEVEISMEVDEDGNRIWRAEDSRVPGSTSQGSSMEEAMEGVEDRRRKFREMLRRSRERRKRREEAED